jgi:hypothetical protein
MAKKIVKKAPKKIPSTKAAKPVKSAKNGGLGAALKSAAKSVVKTLAPAPAKKAALPPKKGAAPAKPEKALAGKKGETGKKLVPPPAPAAKGKSAPALTLVKSAEGATIKKGKKEDLKKGAKGAAPEAPVKGKKGKEMVLEVPAPKGVAVIAKEGKGKKATKAEAAAAAKAKRCREPGCEHDFTLVGYCRLHYIKNWRRVKRKEAILASGQLNNYVEELVSKYPDKYLDVIRQDLASEKEWGKAVIDLELEGSEEEGGAEEDIDTVAEGVRPSGGGGGSRGEFDDEGDAF